jgi:hypothetical protein
MNLVSRIFLTRHPVQEKCTLFLTKTRRVSQLGEVTVMSENLENVDHEQLDEQMQLAREIGEELTDAFVAYVQGEVSFEDLTFGVFDALSDLHVIAGGNYELTADEDHDHEHDHGDDEDELVYDEEEAIDDQEELSQEPSRS